ncbi:MAG: 4Fe-4S ferredoxin [Desulfobulbaceae bacterium A2]|nr:MAG: 4Fe-4S ferredoxin [Desulfobulbaceae bacterium A2]
MDKKRRDFLKIAGISTLAGLGAPAVVNQFLLGGDGKALASGAGAAAAPAAQHGSQPAQKTGKRWGMVIDTRKFRATPGLAERCVQACHRVHNVPSFPEKKDEIKWIWLTDYESAFTEQSQLYVSDAVRQNKLMVLCNHCDNPPCVRACPTQATFRNDEGIVMMDYHRCIGCRFCMAACPYGSRSFNWRDPRPFISEQSKEYPTRMRGVVEKCTFCAERIAVGKEPACVEACAMTGAIVFGDLNDPKSKIRQVLKTEYTIQRKAELGTSPSVFYII